MTEPNSNDQLDPHFEEVTQIMDEADEVLSPPVGPDGTAPNILPLGHSQYTFYFLGAAGENLVLTAREMVRNNIVCLFGGNTEWLCRNFPMFNKQKEKIPGEFSVSKASEWLMRQGNKVGIYNPETVVRGVGVWRSGRHVVAHLGGSIWYRGHIQKTGCVIAGAIYPARNTMEEPDFTNPADKLEGGHGPQKGTFLFCVDTR